MLYPQVNAHRSIQDLGGFWKFKADEQKRGEIEGWHNEVPADRELAVPASWNEQNSDLMYFFGTGWYEREFEAPVLREDQTCWIRIGSANYYSKVWINGQLAGENEGAHLPFQFDVTDYIRQGTSNRIVVAVDAEIKADRLPPGDVENEMIVGFKGQYPNNYYDFFPYGGIQRPVQLLVMPRAHIARIAVQTDIQGQSGHVDFQANLSVPHSGQLEVSWGSGQSETVEITDGQASGRIELPDVKLWSPEDPHLYSFQFKLNAGGQVTDSYSLSVGVRTIAIEGDRLLLNGAPVFLRGVGMHEDFPVIGKGLNHAVIVKDISMIEWLGGNSLRTTHYPYSEEFLQYADRKGILVIGESPFVGFVKSHYRSAEIEDKAGRGLNRMVERDRNHPSVIAWSLANEPDSLDEGAGPFFKKLYDTVKGLDATRPITFVNCVDTDKDTAMEHMDFVSLNRYHGWYVEAGRLDDGCKELDHALDRCHARFHKPIIVTEFGADAIAGVHTDPPELFTEEYQADMLTRQYTIMRNKPYMIGAHIWALSDFKTSQTPSRVVVNRKGLFTRERYPKLAAHRIKALWAQE